MPCRYRGTRRFSPQSRAAIRSVRARPASFSSKTPASTPRAFSKSYAAIQPEPARRGLPFGAWRQSVRMAWHFRAPAAHEEIEVASLVRLQHVFDIEVPIAACIGRHRLSLLFPFGEPRRQFGLADVQMQPSGVTVHLDPVAVAHHCE